MTGAESESLLELSARQVDVYTQCCCPSSAAARSQTQMPAQSTPPAFGSQPSPSTSSQCEPCARNQLRAVASSGVACAGAAPWGSAACGSRRRSSQPLAGSRRRATSRSACSSGRCGHTACQSLPRSSCTDAGKGRTKERSRRIRLGTADRREPSRSSRTCPPSCSRQTQHLCTPTNRSATQQPSQSDGVCGAYILACCG